MLVVGSLSLPFDNQTTALVKKCVSSAIGKIYKTSQLEGTWAGGTVIDQLKLSLAWHLFTEF